jgi:hypothetical protein
LWHDRPVLELLRTMPNGVRVFVAYGFAVLVVIALALPGVVSLAVDIPISGPGVVTMLLLAYTVFTMTLALQRKRVAYGLAIGLSSLTLPLLIFFALVGSVPAAVFAAVLAGGLFLGLSRPASRRWFDQQ